MTHTIPTKLKITLKTQPTQITTLPIKTIDHAIYKSVKCKLNTIFKHSEIIPMIRRTACEINVHVRYAYQLLASYFKTTYYNGDQLPNITKDLILYVIKTLTTGEGDDRPITEMKDTKLSHLIQNDINHHYDTYFSKRIPHFPNGDRKTYLFEEVAKEMFTCTLTNLKTHFLDYLFKYINILFKNPEKELIRKGTHAKTERKKLYSALNTKIGHLKYAIMTGILSECASEYHQWIIDNRPRLLPTNIKECVAYDIKARPNVYLKYAFYINEQIQLLGCRPYQIIPQRTDGSPCNITINTSVLLFIIDDTKEIFNICRTILKDNIKFYNDFIWNTILKKERTKIFNQNDYVFYNQIKSDGISCSLLRINIRTMSRI